MNVHKASTKTLALNLRKKGYPYSYIADRTGLSKSTLSDWLSTVPYVPNKETVERVGKAIAASNARKTQRRQESIRHIHKVAAREIPSISKRDLFMFGLGLYLGEGSKTGDLVRVINADPRVIQAVVSWFKSLGVKRSQFAPRIHLYPDNDMVASLQFWSRTTSIPITQFQKAHIDRRTDKKSKKRGKLPFGTLHLGVRSSGRKEYGVFFFRKIQAWNEAVLRAIRAGVV